MIDLHAEMDRNLHALEHEVIERFLGHDRALAAFLYPECYRPKPAAEKNQP